jgi:hypothetical protein
MHDDTRPHDDDQTTPVPAVNFDGRTPGRAPAIRAGVVLGAALVIALGTAVVMGASAGPSAPTVGADPAASPSASAKAEREGQGNGNEKLKDKPGKGLGRGDRFGGVAFGRITVTAVSGSKVSLATTDGWTRTITVTTDTKITKGGEAATIGDVKVGDVVRLGQKKNDDGTFTVTRLAIILPQAAGTVTAVDANSVTIKVRGGTTQAVNTNGSTKYHLGDADGSRSDVKVGSTVVVVGEKATNGNLTATSVTVILPRVGGTVASVSGNTITITRRDGTKLTVHVSAGTSIRVGGVDKATVADVKAGMAIAVVGVQRADGSLDATKVRAGQPGKNGPKIKAPKDRPNASAAPSASTG